MREFYFYQRNNLKEPRLTFCLLEESGETARGMAICSHRDMPNKTTGRAIAFGRAIKALRAKQDVCPINRIEAIDILAEFSGIPYTEIPDLFKGEYMPKLTEMEEKLLQKCQ